VGEIHNDLPYVLNRSRRPRSPLPGLQEAVVVTADAAGVRFTVPAFHTDLAFGPTLNWSRPAVEAGYPPAGTRCLVAFAGEDLTAAWVVAWANWPA
jgi:hypothetical protein